MKRAGTAQGKSVPDLDGSKHRMFCDWIFIRVGVGPGILLTLRYYSKFSQIGADRTGQDHPDFPIHLGSKTVHKHTTTKQRNKQGQTAVDVPKAWSTAATGDARAKW